MYVFYIIHYIYILYIYIYIYMCIYICIYIFKVNLFYSSKAIVEPNQNSLHGIS